MLLFKLTGLTGNSISARYHIAREISNKYQEMHYRPWNDNFIEFVVETEGLTVSQLTEDIYLALDGYLNTRKQVLNPLNHATNRQLEYLILELADIANYSIKKNPQIDILADHAKCVLEERKHIRSIIFDGTTGEYLDFIDSIQNEPNWFYGEKSREIIYLC